MSPLEVESVPRLGSEMENAYPGWNRPKGRAWSSGFGSWTVSLV
jgi:hypothetical protein